MTTAANWPSQPALQSIAVTPSDSNLISPEFRALYIGGSGDVRIQDLAGNQTTFKAVPTGLILPVFGNIVFASGTTATFIVALY